ncbi:MAG TPA: formate/nitrite transporter family protein [Ktedonobacterales bacterium]|nr:formate/nitrite transporter family protein [Ktedonobacterales bacterium]
MAKSLAGQAPSERKDDRGAEENENELEKLEPEAEKPYPSGSGPGALPELGQVERHQVAERVAISAAVVHETVREEGERELGRHPTALAWSSLAAGLSMGFSMVGMGLIQAALPDTPWRPLLDSFGYSLGFLIVVLGRQQLFTENTLTVILPLFAHPDVRTILRVIRLWSIVLVGNLLGAFIFASIVAHTPLFSIAQQHTFLNLGLHALRGDFGLVVLRGVFAGWLIALMVWLLPAADAAKLQIIIILTYFIALGGFAHIIAGSVDTLYGVSIGAITWPKYLGGFLAPTLIGNIVGGVSLVAFLNYAQVAAETIGQRSGSRPKSQR